MSTGYLLIGLCALIILSFAYMLIAQKMKIPSVLLLIGTGLLLRAIALHYEIEIRDVRLPLELLGVVGLVLIVLEGSLDLELSREKIPLIRRSFLAALTILGLTACGLTLIIHYAVDLPWHYALVYSVPMGIISSAIAIPSATGLRNDKREFIIYESTFSDILGIMLFNYVIAENLFNWDSTLDFGIGFIGIIIVAVIATAFLMILLNGIKTHTRFILLLAYILLVYSLVKLLHWPALLMILMMGVVLNNVTTLLPESVTKLIQPQKMAVLTRDMKSVTAESAFLIRTFFFVLFGFSIDIVTITHHDVIITGSLITIFIIVARAFFLRFISKTHLFPEFLIAPRGLITVLLYYSIPENFKSPLFNDGIVLFVIISSNLLMTFGLLFSDTKQAENTSELH